MNPPNPPPVGIDQVVATQMMVIQQMTVTKMKNQIRQEREEIRQDRLEIHQEIRQAQLRLGEPAMILLLFPYWQYFLCTFMYKCKSSCWKLGSKSKGDKTCIWVPKAIVTNLVGPNKS
jgi:hypothetical protein